MKALDDFYEQQVEPNKGSLLALRYILLNKDHSLTEEWKYRLPFFYYKGKMLCYLWIDKKTKQPYIGWVDGNKIDHPLLVQANRKRMKVLYIDPYKDIPVKIIHYILKQALSLHHKT
jgi:Domain of unknown function (DU1801)